MTDAPLRLLIADDQTLFRAGLALLLSDDPRVRVVAQAVDGEDAVRQCAQHKPDVVLMDMQMPNLDGVRATARIVEAQPDVLIVILTSFETDSQVVDALRAGASGYVLKDSSPEAIVSTLLAVRSGERVMSGSVALSMLGMITGDSGPNEAHDGLTSREVEIVKLIAGGSGNKQIAYKLSISDKTVRNHISNINTKLGIDDRSQAVLYALRRGLVAL